MPLAYPAAAEIVLVPEMIELSAGAVITTVKKPITHSLNLLPSSVSHALASTWVWTFCVDSVTSRHAERATPARPAQLPLRPWGIYPPVGALGVLTFERPATPSLIKRFINASPIAAMYAERSLALTSQAMPAPIV